MLPLAQSWNRRRKAATAGGFAPTDIAGVKLWQKADAGLYDATSGGSLVTADGAAVARQEDQGGSGNHATQATSGARPLLKTGVLNGRSVLRYDGTDDQIATAAGVVASHPLTIFAVVTLLSAPASYDPVLIGGGGNNNFRLLLKTGGSNWGTYGGSDKNASSALSSGSTYLLCIVADAGGGGTFYKNAAADGTYAGVMHGDFSGGGDKVAAEPGAGRFSNIDLPELLVYDTALSDTNRQSVESYLNGRYAIY